MINLFNIFKSNQHNCNKSKLNQSNQLNFIPLKQQSKNAIKTIKFALILFFITFAFSIIIFTLATAFIENISHTTQSNSKTYNAKVFALDTSTNATSKANENYYAQIQNKNVYLYNAPFGSPLFEIPETYYVKLLEKSKNGFYKAQYIDIIGYIMETEIQCVANPPATPFLSTVSFRNYGAQSSELRTEPTRLGGTSTLICELPLYETNFTYYGRVSGEEVVPNRSDIWFYCSYTKNNQTKQGYIYSGLIDMMTSYISNPIDPYPILKHEWKEDKQTETTGATLSLPSKKQTLIILAITIPIIALVALMFKPMQAKKQPPKTNKNGNSSNLKGKNNNDKSSRTITLENPRYTATALSQTSPFKQQAQSHFHSNATRTSPFSSSNQPTSPQNYFKQTTKAKKGKDFYEL